MTKRPGTPQAISPAPGGIGTAGPCATAAGDAAAGEVSLSGAAERPAVTGSARAVFPQAFRAHAGPAAVVAVLMGLALLLAFRQAAPILAAPQPAPDAASAMAATLFFFSTLPRMATALLAGACLALSGALFQLVLRNPLASPTTLGISAGANLALVAAMLFMPGLLGFGRDLVALTGSLLAAGLVFLMGARHQFSPFSLVMSGLVVSLWCGALAAVLTLLNDRYLESLFIWGAGSLSQQSWTIPLSLLPKLGLAGLLVVLLLRPLFLNELGEAGAKALGLRMAELRLAAIVIAVALAAFVTSAVGVIGFIGLVAPTIARLAGTRRPGAQLFWSTLIGAGLLFLTDTALMALAGQIADFLPTGAVTAIFGSPLLLILLPRLKTRHRVMQAPAAGRRVAAVFAGSRGGAALRVILPVAMLVLLLAVFFGRSPDMSFRLMPPALFGDLLSLRLPRILAAFAAGMMLAAAGSILQRLTGNEMASPEVLGISAGATLGVAVAVFVIAAPGLFTQLGFSALGAFAVLAIIVLTASRSGLQPERVLLAGIALGAMVDAVVGVIGATGDPRAIFLLRWMSGSTYGVTLEGAMLAGLAAALLLSLTALCRRWLDLLPLGASAASAIGVPLRQARLALMGLAGLLSAAATMSVGPLSFVGLMAPHLARQLGFTRAAPQLLAACLFGGLLMVAADWIGRSAVYPYEIPAGLVSALIGAPFLIVLMRRGR
ncbi:iron complex transport system permease protein [Rhizobium sp. RU35A]|uniref:Fe(3+)-hydroxamate ABC transporter permease FhuB n=1 Tax=Rhizobium sp. RU35A TaxID=1907414 RepID=UPI00095502DB|nr:Fe(3+)-hydroxamate ABC transporter permease FhuB [Rhizobium sp. RU35A]SIQ94402.1 iron complex transport system permease protein [Rhizobium sp. RU35A]